MKTRREHEGKGVAWTWRQELARQAGEIEDWVDRMALRLGDAVFGERTSEKLFGPHPIRR